MFAFSATLATLLTSGAHAAQLHNNEDAKSVLAQTSADTLIDMETEYGSWTILAQVDPL